MKLEILQKDMIAAMKARDKEKKDSISSLIQAVKKVAIDEGCRDDISEELVDRVILKEQKTAKEQLDTCPADRTDLIEQYKARYEVISSYAPVMMSEDEVKAFILEKFSEELESKNKGMIMKSVMPALKGKADGRVISSVVDGLCK